METDTQGGAPFLAQSARPSSKKLESMLPDLLEEVEGTLVLSELEIDAQVEILPPQEPRGFDDRPQALEQLGRRLYLAPGSRQMAELESMLPDLLEEVEGTLVIRGSVQTLEPGLVIWSPSGAGELKSRFSPVGFQWLAVPCKDYSQIPGTC